MREETNSSQQQLLPPQEPTPRKETNPPQTAVRHAGNRHIMETISVIPETTTVDVIGTPVIVAAKVTITCTRTVGMTVALIQTLLYLPQHHQMVVCCDVVELVLSLLMWVMVCVTTKTTDVDVIGMEVIVVDSTIVTVSVTIASV
jgi:uncharacterized protein with PQ loop repeat